MFHKLSLFRYFEKNYPDIRISGRPANYGKLVMRQADFKFWTLVFGIWYLYLDLGIWLLVLVLVFGENTMNVQYSTVLFSTVQYSTVWALAPLRVNIYFFYFYFFFLFWEPIWLRGGGEGSRPSWSKTNIYFFNTSLNHFTSELWICFLWLVEINIKTLHWRRNTDQLQY